MEDVMRRSNHGGGIKEERGSVDADRRYIGSVGGDESDCKEVVVAMVVGSNPRKSSSPEQEGLSLTKEVPIKEGRSTMESDPKAPSSISNLLESARAEMGEAREENQRLKMYLDQKMKDYQALQMQFYGIIQQEETKESTETTANSHKVFEEQDPVSLSLGFSRDPKSDNGTKNLKISGQRADAEEVDRGLSLGLDCKFDLPKSYTSEKRSPVNSLEEAKEEYGETWRPSKVMKTIRSGDDDEVLQQNPFKKARVSVRARCDNPTMNDGCQWRKYGQKISKGNPCPRAYYRCTIGSSCPVRKQVQRCADDMSILIATYEGTHNHPLPVSATPMASTTSAAASMLLTGSSSSSSSALHGLKFYLSNDNSKLSNNPFYIQNPSLASSLSHPTITLDLTSNPPTSSSHFNSFPSSYVPVPKFPSTSFSFGSSESSAMAGGNVYPSYGSTSQHYNRNHLGTLINLGRQSVDSNIYQSYMQKNPHPRPSLPDTVAAATKAITADASFQSALAAALSSLIGTGSGNSSTACSSSYTNK